VAIAALASKVFPLSLTLLFSLNVWCLSMPHSFSTFTRHDLRTLRIGVKATLLYLVFFISLSMLMNRIGLVTIYSFYFYWQQFHYTKQNMGIGIWKKTDRSLRERSIDYSFYFFISIFSIAASFYGGGIQFFGYSLLNPFIWFTLSPFSVIMLNLILLGFYVYLRPGYWKMALTHTLIYTLAYLVLDNFVLGWVLLNIFHNSQYLFFMNQEEKNLRFFLYAALLSVGFYMVLHASFLIAASIAIMLAMNFTHYIFDGLVWKKNFHLKSLWA
jgi:hypothetical protein